MKRVCGCMMVIVVGLLLVNCDGGGGEPIVANVEYPIAADADDAYFWEFVAGGWVLVDDASLVVGKAGIILLGRPMCRWAVSIPKGGTIRAATVTFVGGQALPSAQNYDIYLVDEDDCPLPSTFAADQSDLGLAGGEIAWQIPAFGVGETVETPDIGSLVQAYIDRPGYGTGQYIGLYLKEDGVPTDGGWFYAHNFGADYPILRVTYSVCMVPLLAARTMY